MWITTCHRFTNRAEFLAACQAAGWGCPPGQEPNLPQGVAMDILGALIGPASVGDGGVPIAGEVIDPGYHVNLAWHGREPDQAFEASLVAPAAPSRGWDITAPPVGHPPLPGDVALWQFRAALKLAGHFERVQGALGQLATPQAMLAAELFEYGDRIERRSSLTLEVARLLEVTDEDVDALFRRAAETRP